MLLKNTSEKKNWIPDNHEGMTIKRKINFGNSPEGWDPEKIPASAGMTVHLRMRTVAIILFLSFPIFAQESVQQNEFDSSRYELGAEEEIFNGDIDPAILEQVKFAMWELEEIQNELVGLSGEELRLELREAIKRAADSIQDESEVTLTRYMLHRALQLEKSFSEEEDGQVVDYIFMPAVRHALHLYREGDQIFFRDGFSSMERPAFVALTKSTLGYILNIADFASGYAETYRVLKLAVKWTLNDLYRAKAVSRKMINEIIYAELVEVSKNFQKDPYGAVTVEEINELKDALLNVYEQIHTEKGVQIRECLVKNRTNYPAQHARDEEDRIKKALDKYPYGSSAKEVLSFEVGAGTMNAKSFNGAERNFFQVSKINFSVINGNDYFHRANGSKVEFFQGTVFDFSYLGKLSNKRKELGDAKYKIDVLKGHVLFDKGKHRGGLRLITYSEKRDDFRKMKTDNHMDLGFIYRYLPTGHDNSFLDIKLTSPVGGQINLTSVEPSQEWRDHYEAVVGHKPSDQEIRGIQKSDTSRFSRIKLEASYSHFFQTRSLGDVYFEIGGEYRDNTLHFRTEADEPFKTVEISPHLGVVDREADSWGAHFKLVFFGDDLADLEFKSKSNHESGRRPAISSWEFNAFIENVKMHRELMKVFNPAHAGGLVEEISGASLSYKLSF